MTEVLGREVRFYSPSLAFEPEPQASNRQLTLCEVSFSETGRSLTTQLPEGPVARQLDRKKKVFADAFPD